jgi:hypothetical protein
MRYAILLLVAVMSEEFALDGRKLQVVIFQPAYHCLTR